MKKISVELLNYIKKYGFLVLAVAALLIPDYLLRSISDPQFKDQFAMIPRIFSGCWVCLYVFLCAVVLPKVAGKIVYIIITSFYVVLSLCQYVYFQIFDQFFWIRSIMLADEGASYLGYAASYIDGTLIVGVILALLFMVLAAVWWKKPKLPAKRWYLVGLVPILVIIGTHLYLQPGLHKESTDTWDSWRKPQVVYDRFTDVNKGYEIAGLYQFVARDFYKTFFDSGEYGKKDFEKVDAFFEEKGKTPENAYTGLFKGKNVIAIMLESIDTWMVNETYMPTLHQMMQESINFTNYNAPFFGVGFTFNSEFAFNTGFYTPVSAVSAANFSTNSFPYALPRLFSEAGYTVNSFHFNDSEFYNRGIMHKSFGYEKYNSFMDFGMPDYEAHLDSNVLKNDEIYEKMVEETPFFNYIITYSAHLPYDNVQEPRLVTIRERHPELIDPVISREKNYALMMAHDTDEFLKQLLERLEEDGLLEDTIIVGYTDHFAYGIPEPVLLSQCKTEDFKYRVPAFIYAAGQHVEEVSKPMMTLDWVPTLVNLFGLDRSGTYIGGDVLAPENPGFAYFETFAWMDENMYYEPNAEEPVAADQEYIEKQNNRVRESREINDIIVLGDYYKKR